MQLPPNIKQALDLIFQIAVVIIGIGFTVFWLFSDRHNDDRYVRIVEYHQYQLDTNQKIEELKSGLEKNATRVEEKLEKIQGYILDILWRIGGDKNENRNHSSITAQRVPSYC